MDPFFVAYLDRLTVLMEGLDRALAGLPADALDWSPGPELNSLTVLATHAAAATRFWIGDVAGLDTSGRVRAQEFESHGQDATALQARVAEVLEHSRRVVQGLSNADLGTAREVTQFSRTCTVAWALLHALDHLAEHVGHAQMTRQLWMQQQSVQ